MMTYIVVQSAESIEDEEDEDEPVNKLTVLHQSSSKKEAEKAYKRAIKAYPSKDEAREAEEWGLIRLFGIDGPWAVIFEDQEPDEDDDGETPEEGLQAYSASSKKEAEEILQAWLTDSFDEEDAEIARKEALIIPLQPVKVGAR